MAAASRNGNRGQPRRDWTHARPTVLDAFAGRADARAQSGPPRVECECRIEARGGAAGRAAGLPLRTSNERLCCARLAPATAWNRAPRWPSPNRPGSGEDGGTTLCVPPAGRGRAIRKPVDAANARGVDRGWAGGLHGARHRRKRASLRCNATPARSDMPEIPDVSTIAQQIKARIKYIEDQLKQHHVLSDELERLRAALVRLEGQARSRVTTGRRANRRQRRPGALRGPALRSPQVRRHARRAGRTRPRCSTRSRPAR